MIESFWATLKKELVYCNPKFKTRDEARIAIFEYIEVYYNRERLHSSLLYQTPQGFELKLQNQADASLIQKAA
jgi:transposase InsO family protein